MSQGLVAQRLDAQAAKALDREKFQHRVMTLWLQGYTVDEIRRNEGLVEQATVIQAINIKRKEIRAVQEADLLDLAAERIAGLKLVKTEARAFAALYPGKAAQFLTVILRSEEIEAKIEGVLSDKVLHLGRIQHDVKLYDFTDRTPPMPRSFIVPPELVTISEPYLEALPEPPIVAFDMNQNGVISSGDIEVPKPEPGAMTVVTSWG